MHRITIEWNLLPFYRLENTILIFNYKIYDAGYVGVVEINMKKQIEYKTKGTCSRMVSVETEDDIITDCIFVGGCSGNTQGVAALVKGMKIEDAISKMKGIRCGFKETSCPDQLAKALEKILNETTV